MGVGAEADHVVAGILHVGALRAIPAGHVADGEADLEGLALAGLEKLGLVEVAEHDGALLEAALGVGSGVVDLHDVLAGHGAGVGDGHLGDDVIALDGHGVEGLLEGGVGQAVAEREDDGLVVVDEALGGSGLVVAVAVVDALFVLDEVGLVAGLGPETGDVSVLEGAEVVEGRVLGEVGGPEVSGAAGGVDLAGDDLAHGGGAGCAERADVQDGVDLVLALGEDADLHGGGEVEQDDDLVGASLGSRDHVLLLLGELELVLALDVVGGLSVGSEVLGNAGVERAEKVLAEVAALAAATADHDDRGGAGQGVLSICGIVGPGNLTCVIGGRLGAVHHDVGLGVAVLVGKGELVEGIVHREAGVLQAGEEVNARRGVDGAGAGATVDGIGAVAADEGDGAGDGQRAVVVLHEDDALALDLGHHLLGSLGGHDAATVLRGVVLGVPVLGALGDLHRSGVAAARRVLVEGRVEHDGSDVGRNHDDREDREDDGQDLAASLPFCHFSSYVKGSFLPPVPFPKTRATNSRSAL